MWEAIEITDEEYLPKLAELATEHYGEGNDTANLSYLKHEYFGNPSGRAILYIAYDKDTRLAAGQIATIPVELKIGADSHKCLLAVNALTRKAYRAQGVFRTLASKVCEKADKDNFATAFAMPNQYSYPGFLKYLGFSDIGRVPLYVRPIMPSRLVKSFLHSNLLSACARIFDILFKIKNEHADCVLYDFKTCVDQYSDEFWDVIKDKADVMVVRKKDYLKWRYIDMPCRDYLGYYALSDGVPVAVAVGRNMEVSGINCAMIADFLFADGHEAAGMAALNQLLKDLQDRGAELAGCMVPRGSEEHKVLRKMKFFKCPVFLEPQPFKMIQRQFDLSDDSISVSSDLSNWFFTLGDYDVV